MVLTNGENGDQFYRNIIVESLDLGKRSASEASIVTDSLRVSLGRFSVSYLLSRTVHNVSIPD